jgi:hypothetical protein
VIDIATAQLKRLMSEHNLTMAAVDVAIEWRRAIVEPVAKFNHSRVVEGDQLRLLGRPHDVVAAKAMLEHLTVSVAVLAVSRLKDLKEIKSFYKGASDRLTERLSEKEEAPEKKAEAPTVELTEAESQEQMAKYEVSAYFEGRAAADDILLTPSTQKEIENGHGKIHESY